MGALLLLLLLLPLPVLARLLLLADLLLRSICVQGLSLSEMLAAAAAVVNFERSLLPSSSALSSPLSAKEAKGLLLLLAFFLGRTGPAAGVGAGLGMAVGVAMGEGLAEAREEEAGGGRSRYVTKRVAV
jgi:hypothetical protein